MVNALLTARALGASGDLLRPARRRPECRGHVGPSPCRSRGGGSDQRGGLARTTRPCAPRWSLLDRRARQVLRVGPALRALWRPEGWAGGARWARRIRMRLTAWWAA